MAPVASRAGHRIFLLAFLAFAALLFWRCSQEACWSEWVVGDSQTLQTLRHWQEDGFWFHKGLFIPQGYSKTTRYLDEPPLRQHAHGISPWSSPGVGPRLHYTHYPAGYLWPHYLLYCFGLRDHRGFSMVALGCSLAAVWVWFQVFQHLAGTPAASLACLFYLGSNVFLGFAHSLANQPWDDLLRACGVLFVILESGAGSPQARLRFSLMTWGSLLLLTACSLDSVLFGLCWILGWDLLHARRRPLVWVLFLCAPLLAFVLQLLQNAWYLGIVEALRDVRATLIQKSLLGPSSPLRSLQAMGKGMLPLLGVHPWAGSLLAGVAFWAVAREGLGRILLLLLACGSLFALFLPRAGDMGYQGRQLAPCVCLLMGASTALLFRLVRGWRLLRGGRSVLFAGLLLFCGLGWWSTLKQGWERFQYVPGLLSRSSDCHLAKALGARFRGDRVYFNVNAFAEKWTLKYVPGYPQVYSLVEYYADGPILSFDTPELLAEDLQALWRCSEYPFSAVLLADRSEILAQVWAALRRDNPGAVPEAPPWQGLLLPGGKVVTVVDLSPGIPSR